MVQVAEQVGNNPSASLPNQIERWSDLKAAYQLFASDKVTFEGIARPHWELVKQSASGRCLVIGDTTEFDFGKDREIDIVFTNDVAAFFQKRLTGIGVSLFIL